MAARRESRRDRQVRSPLRELAGFTKLTSERRPNTRRRTRLPARVRLAQSGQPELAGGLAALEQLRTDLLSTVAHELRTPLTAVRTSIGLLLDKSVQPQPEMREQLLQSMSQSSERMQRLVSDVLDLARSRLGGMPLQLRRFDAVDLAREVAAPLQALVGSRPGRRLDSH